MSSQTTYYLTDFDNIKNEGFSYELPEYTLMLINKISRQVGAPSYIKTPIFKKNRYNNDKHESMRDVKPRAHMNDKTTNRRNKRHNKNGKVKEMTDIEWDTIRNFESTKMEKAKDECEKALNDIRCLLNKLSKDTYKTIKDDILFKLYELRQMDILDVKETNTLWENICELVINTSCNNAFYSEEYVRLLKDIYNKYDTIETHFKGMLYKCMDTFYDIEYVDADEDYDRFCKNNIISKHRRSLATFISNLYINDLITCEEYTEIVYKVIDTFLSSIEEQDKQYVCEELSEVIFSLIPNNKSLLEIETFSDYFDKIVCVTNMRPKNKPSLSNKIIFKLCDIVDSFTE